MPPMTEIHPDLLVGSLHFSGPGGGGPLDAASAAREAHLRSSTGALVAFDSCGARRVQAYLDLEPPLPTTLDAQSVGIVIVVDTTSHHTKVLVGGRKHWVHVSLLRQVT